MRRGLKRIGFTKGMLCAASRSLFPDEEGTETNVYALALRLDHVAVCSPMRRGLKHWNSTAGSGSEVRRSLFPDEEGTETVKTVHGAVRGKSRSLFPDEEGTEIEHRDALAHDAR